MEKRKILPGGEWLYLKVYTGIKTADLILEEVVYPLMKYLQQNDKISKWFFIRYHDPKPHLRLRFKVIDSENHQKIMSKINQVLEKYFESGEISNVSIDTYNQEIERYGRNTMEDAETLFHHNSDFTLLCLQYDDEEKIILVLFYINEVLSKLNLSIQDKLDWIRDFNTAFKQEFNADKKLNSQLDKKYRNFKPKFVEFTQSEEFSEERDIITSNIQRSNSTLLNIIRYNENHSLEISLQDFFQSIFHMNINRLFVSNQRLFEMIIYDYLLRYYKAAAYQCS